MHLVGVSSSLQNGCVSCIGAKAAPAKKDDDNTPIIIAVVVVVVILIAVVVVVLAMKSKSEPKTGADGRAVVSFENPMYANAGQAKAGLPPPQQDGMATSGYQVCMRLAAASSLTRMICHAACLPMPFYTKQL